MSKLFVRRTAVEAVGGTARSALTLNFAAFVADAVRDTSGLSGFSRPIESVAPFICLTRYDNKVYCFIVLMFLSEGFFSSRLA